MHLINSAREQPFRRETLSKLIVYTYLPNKFNIKNVNTNFKYFNLVWHSENKQK